MAANNWTFLHLDLTAAAIICTELDCINLDWTETANNSIVDLIWPAHINAGASGLRAGQLKSTQQLCVLLLLKLKAALKIGAQNRPPQGVGHKNRNELIGNLLKKAQIRVLTNIENPTKCRGFPIESPFLDIFH